MELLSNLDLFKTSQSLVIMFTDNKQLMLDSLIMIWTSNNSTTSRSKHNNTLRFKNLLVRQYLELF